jgi:ABC-type multidrug transport system fused ATPase/permease subunit
MQGKPRAAATKGPGREQQALWGYVRQHKITAFGALLVIALQVALGVLLARQLGAIIDVGILADREAFGQTFLLLVLVWVGGDIALLLRQLLTGELAESVMHDLRAQVAMHLGRARIPALEQMHSGEYISRLSNDAQVVRSAFARHLPSLVQGSLGFVASLVVAITA